MENKFNDLIELEISSQVFSKNGWMLIKKFKNKNNNYYALVECEACKSQQLVNYYNFINVNIEAKKCKDCINYSDIHSDIIGNTYGDIKVISFDRFEKATTKSRGEEIRFYFLTKCIKCGKETVRFFNKTQWNKTSGCKSCNVAFDIPSLNDILRVYKDGARSRNINWCLTNDQFLNLISKNCYYCGNIPQIRKHDRSVNKKEVNGIDRLDSSKGYTIDNCVTCCTMCNYMKLSSSKNEFLNHVEKIYNYQLEKKGSTTIETTSNDGRE